MYEQKGYKSAPVVIEDDVWLGFRSIILPGISLGKGSVVGAGAVVTKDVPPYAVVVGNPGRIIKYLDPNDTDEVREQALHQFIK